MLNYSVAELRINTFVFNYKRGYYMLGVLVWIVVILLICFSVTGWYWIIFYVVILPFSTLLFFFYVDFPENRFNIKKIQE